MHTKTDSEVTNLAPSSPTRSPSRCPIYYVQSASRDSHNGEKTATSFQSTPIISPSGSPPTPFLRRPPHMQVLIHTVLRVTQTRIPKD
ncbi:hypothetical protein ACFX2J_031743 [Malus domestica]